VIQRALILQSGEFIQLSDLQLDNLPSSVDSDPTAIRSNKKLDFDVKNHEYQLILDALEKFKGSRSKIAEELGISPRTLRYKLAKMRGAGYQITT